MNEQAQTSESDTEEQQEEQAGEVRETANGEQQHTAAAQSSVH